MAELSTMLLLSRHRLADTARHLTWSGRRLVAGVHDGSVLGVDTEHTAAASPLELHRFDAPVSALAGADGHLVAGSANGWVATLTASGGRRQERCAGAVRALAANGPRVVAAVADQLLVLDHPHQRVDPGIGPLTSVAHVVGNLVACGGVAGLAWVDIAMGVCDGTVDLPTIVALATDPLRRFVAAGDLGGAIHLLVPGTSDGIELAGYPDRVALLAWLAQGAALCAVADDEITVWQVHDDQVAEDDEPLQLVGHDHPVTAIAASPEAPLLASADASGQLALWSPTVVDRPAARAHLGATVVALGFDRTGRHLAAATSAGEIAIWKVDPGEIA